MKTICPCCKQEKEFEIVELSYRITCDDCCEDYKFDNLVISKILINEFINTRLGIYVERDYYIGFILFLNHFNLKNDDGDIHIENYMFEKEYVIINYNFGTLTKEISYSKSIDFSLSSKSNERVYDIVNKKYLK